ncbi:hypothetical protein HQQ80_00385 [Microbacteriaceae bacterium VKM Ac-2855]|nr:hypothetical protein [Microbacteriaceae bacterium VKM Ac-2855]
MQWWNEFVTWLQTIDGHRSVFLAAVVLVAVVVGVVISGLITSGAIRRLLATQQRELKNNVIATLVDAAAEASAWESLPPAVRVQSDRASAQAETLLRLLPIKGAGVAANWAAHELEALKRGSSEAKDATTVAVFRERLIEWRNKPGKARKKFVADLERWSYLDTAAPQVDPRRAAPAAVASEAPREVEPVVVAPTGFEKPVADTAKDSGSVNSPAAIEPDTSESATTEPTAVGSTADESKATISRSPETTAVPTIALETPHGKPSTDETERLLADIDALEVRSNPRPVEEFSPVAAVIRSTETPRSGNSGSEPQGTL